MSFPPNTDPRKTYKWRYLENFCDKIDEWGITESTAYRVIDAMVEHAKRHGQLHQRGIAILSSEQMLDIGYESLCRNEQTIDTIVERIRSDRKFILSLPNLDLLSARENPNSFTNLVKWATQGKISLYYIAISKSCGLAMRKLDKFEREMIIPRTIELVEARRIICKNVITKHKIKLILREDWGLEC